MWEQSQEQKCDHRDSQGQQQDESELGSECGEEWSQGQELTTRQNQDPSLGQRQAGSITREQAEWQQDAQNS